MVWTGTVWYGIAWYGMLWCDMVLYGMLCCGQWYGVLWYCLVCYELINIFFCFRTCHHSLVEFIVSLATFDIIDYITVVYHLEL